VAGIKRLQSLLEDAISEIATTGIASRKTYDTLEKLLGEGDIDNPATWMKFYFHKVEPQWFPKSNDDDRAPLIKGIKLDKKAASVEHLELCWKDLERERRKLHKREKLASKNERDRLGILDGPALECVQRTEAAATRNLRQAIDQLLQLQRRRNGEPATPSLNVNMSHND